MTFVAFSRIADKIIQLQKTSGNTNNKKAMITRITEICCQQKRIGKVLLLIANIKKHYNTKQANS